MDLAKKILRFLGFAVIVIPLQIAFLQMCLTYGMATGPALIV